MNRRTISGLVLTLLLVVMVPFSFSALRTLHAKEGELIKITPTAADPDNDQIKFTYSAPLDEKGEWQTTLDDAGTYEMEIIASDGANITTEKFLLVIENTNQPPQVAKKKITIHETELVELKKAVFDLDGDALQYQFQSPFNRNGEWKTKHGDAGTYLAAFIVGDGEFEVTARIEVEVLPSNLPPHLSAVFAEEQEIRLFENETLAFWVEAQDDDELEYEWELDGKEIGTEAKGSVHFDFKSEGEYKLQLKVSDGKERVEKEWKIVVENRNREPVLTLLPLSVKEGEKIALTLPAEDEDGDTLQFSFGKPLDQQGVWETNYEDAGEYETTITYSDGEFTEKIKLNLTVLDVDRAPRVQFPAALYAKEGERTIWELEIEDLDGDNLSVNFENLPADASYDARKRTVTWIPNYDIVKRREGRWSNMLNAVRVEQFFLRPQRFPVPVKVCGKELCTDARVEFVTYNVNRPPTLENVTNQIITEGDSLLLRPQVSDLDGDIVHLYFTPPLGKREGRWQTNDEDEGAYTTYITATDGRAGTTLPVNVEVRKRNRPPQIGIPYDALRVNEAQQFLLRVKAEDPDKDNVTVLLKNPPPGAYFADGIFLWAAPFHSVINKTDSWRNRAFQTSPYWNKKLSSDTATTWLEFAATDGETETVHPVKVTITNVNQQPAIVSATPEDKSTVKVGQPVLFQVVVEDQDSDPLQYTWDVGYREEKVTGTNIIERTFIAPGTKKVKVTIDDGWETIEKEWTILVEAEPVQEIAFAEPALPQPKPVYRVYVIRK